MNSIVPAPFLGPLPEQDAGIDVAEAEARLGDDLEPFGHDGRVRDRTREGRDLVVQVLAVRGAVDEPARELEDDGDRLEPAGGAEAVTDERLGRVDERKAL